MTQEEESLAHDALGIDDCIPCCQESDTWQETTGWKFHYATQVQQPLAHDLLHVAMIAFHAAKNLIHGKKFTGKIKMMQALSLHQK